MRTILLFAFLLFPEPVFSTVINTVTITPNNQKKHSDYISSIELVKSHGSYLAKIYLTKFAYKKFSQAYFIYNNGSVKERDFEKYSSLTQVPLTPEKNNTNQQWYFICRLHYKDAEKVSFAIKGKDYSFDVFLKNYIPKSMTKN